MSFAYIATHTGIVYIILLFQVFVASLCLPDLPCCYTAEYFAIVIHTDLIVISTLEREMKVITLSVYTLVKMFFCNCNYDKCSQLLNFDKILRFCKHSSLNITN